MCLCSQCTGNGTYSVAPVPMTARTVTVPPLLPAPQRQDSLTDQLRDVADAADRMGCRDAADWIRRAVGR